MITCSPPPPFSDLTGPSPEAVASQLRDECWLELPPTLVLLLGGLQEVQGCSNVQRDRGQGRVEDTEFVGKGHEEMEALQLKQYCSSKELGGKGRGE